VASGSIDLTLGTLGRLGYRSGLPKIPLGHERLSEQLHQVAEAKDTMRLEATQVVTNRRASNFNARSTRSDRN